MGRLGGSERLGDATVRRVQLVASGPCPSLVGREAGL